MVKEKFGLKKSQNIMKMIVNGLKTSYVLLNIVFPIVMFYDFSLAGNFLSSRVPLAKIDIATNGNLY